MGTRVSLVAVSTEDFTTDGWFKTSREAALVSWKRNRVFRPACPLRRADQSRGTAKAILILGLSMFSRFSMGHIILQKRNIPRKAILRHRY